MAKVSTSDAQSKQHVVPRIRFDEQDLSSFSGLVLFQQLFITVDLKSSLLVSFKFFNTA